MDGISAKILLNYEVTYDYISYYNFVSRYSPGGAIDSLFGTNGTIAVDGTNGVMVEPDQKILVSGNVYDAQNNSDYSISRYNTNGSPDSTFGTNGTTITKFVQGSSIYVNGVAISNNEFIADGYGVDPLSIGILAEYHIGDQTINLDSATAVRGCCNLWLGLAAILPLPPRQIQPIIPLP